VKRNQVYVAVPPVLARFVRAGERVAGGSCVGGAVLARRVVAAPDMATSLADAEVNPIAASLREAFGATVGRPRLRKLIEIGRHVSARLGCLGLFHGLACWPSPLRLARARRFLNAASASESTRAR
jgi:hypothetical protein